MSVYAILKSGVLNKLCYVLVKLSPFAIFCWFNGNTARCDRSCVVKIAAAAKERSRIAPVSNLSFCLTTFVLLFARISAIEPIPQAANAAKVVNSDTFKAVRLDANLLIPDASELLLNIQVPHATIQIEPQGPAKVVRVYSAPSDGKIGVGESVAIFVQFTSSVKLLGLGIPFLVLKTGCHDSSCHIKEVQRLQCQATKGNFAVEFGPQKVANIPWNATTKVFAAYLQRMDQIHHVSVQYSMDENRACTFFGNNITVTFDSMNIAGSDGDFVELRGDTTNSAGDGSVLEHIMYPPFVKATAWEIQKGKLVSDRKAHFVAQTAPDTLQFEYTVQKGDLTSHLEYVSSDSLALSLRASGGVRIVNDDGTNTLANTMLPPPQFKGDWERGLGSSLSKNSALEIDVTIPYVVSVTSPHEDGAFGVGEEILVHVCFSQPIVVAGLPTMMLETGAVDRMITFTRVVMPAGNIAEFKYVVQPMDTSSDLTYTGSTALQLHGGSIRRRSTTPTINVVLNLPLNGQVGSLSFNKNIVINTSSPKVLSVTTTVSDGTYTAGDDIPVIVTFDMPVVVTGVPRLLLSTGSVDLFPGQFVIEAPTRTSSKTIVFPSFNLGLSTDMSKGMQFKIDGQILTVASVQEDEVTMVEAYTATKVDPTDRVHRANLPIYTPGYRPAKYSSGSGTNKLVFVYTIQIGDTSTRLAYVSTLALQLGSGSIKRLATSPLTNAECTLSVPGDPGSLSANSMVQVNTDAPRVTQVKTLTRDGVYKAGDTILFEVIFSLPVVLSSLASVLTNIMTAGTERLALYVQGNGTNSLIFQFECLEDDQVTVFDYPSPEALRPSYGSTLGWIRRKSTFPLVPAVLDLPLGGLSSKGIAIDQGCEVVTDVLTFHEEGMYGVGESIELLVQYSVNVNVDITGGTPTLSISTGAHAVYQRGSGTKILTFKYIVQQFDVSGQVAYPDRYSLKLNGARIEGSSSLKLSSTLLPPPELSRLQVKDNVFVQTSPPMVVSVSTRTHDRVITAGDTIVISVTFDFPVKVSQLSTGAGVPSLLLNVGKGKGVASSYMAAEDSAVYFSFTIAAGQSTHKLSYFGRTALKCTGGKGLNQDSTQNAGQPRAVVFNDVLTTSWSEMSSVTSTRQIRVKSFDLQQFPPLSSFEDGGGLSSIVNFDASMDASTPELVVFSSKLYLVWVEASSAMGNPTQIRVAVLDRRSDQTSPAQWTFVDTKPASSSGINKLPTAIATGPHAVVHNSKLYVAWHENSLGIAQLRVAVYNGVDTTPGWTFVDGNHNTRGLNYAIAQPTQNVRLCSCSAKGALAKVLYATWSEPATTTGTRQIRVAVQSGTDALPVWKFIDGNGVTGLNVNVAKTAELPSIECLGATEVVVGWQEATGSTGSLVVVKAFNGDVTLPQWTRLDGGKGLNFDATQAAQNLKLSVQFLAATQTLFASWDEVDTTGTATQIRVAKLWSRTIPSWKFVDGGAKFSAINDDRSHAASSPSVTFRQAQETVVVTWQERHANGKWHIRSSVLTAPIHEWQAVSQGCILRQSTTSMTAANLVLPRSNTPGSLDFKHSIQVETSKPRVETVALAGDVSTFLTSVHTVQTIDVFNVASITQGEYKLVYGDTFETSCLSWNAPASGANSMQSALHSISGLALQVSVVKDTSAFHDGHRYTITFSFPSMGLQPLTVKAAKCQKFVCLPSPQARFPCNIGLVQANQNIDISSASGVVDVVVRFSFPVIVSTGRPTLALDTGTSTRSATYTTRSAFQEFDVGINMASPVLGGGFRLSYGDFSSGVGVAPIYTTNCIQLVENDDDGVQELRSGLEALAVLNTIGIHALSRRRLQNGYRYAIEFRNSGDMLDLVAADASDCSAVSGNVQTIAVSAALRILSGEIQVQLGTTTSGCIPWNIRAKGAENSMEASLKHLESDRDVPVQVVKDPSAFTYGVKYYVTLMNPVDAKKPLVALTAAACAPFTCEDAGGTATTCTDLRVTSNAEFDVVRAQSEVISLQYRVQASDEAIALTYKSAAALSGTILRSSRNPLLVASLTLPPPPLDLLAQDQVTSMAIVSSDSIPKVSRVYSTSADGTYTAGDVIVILVEFSDKVVVEGRPVVEMNSKSEALYAFGSGSTVLEFYYEVQPGDATADLDCASVAALRTFTIPVSRIRCALCSGSGIDVDPTLPVSGSSSLAWNHAVVVDTGQPTITQVSSSRGNTAIGDRGYGPGDIVDIIVTFSTDVAVTGTPSLALNSGGTAFFTYAGYRQLLDIGVNAASPLTSGQFALAYDGKVSECIDFDDASSVAATSLRSRLLEFEALARIGIVSVVRTNKKNGNQFEVLFDSTKVVDVPLALEVVISDKCDPLEPSLLAQEALVSRSLDDQVVFHYTVGIGHSAAVLDVVSSSVLLDGGKASIMRQAKALVISANAALPLSASPQSLAQTKTLTIDGAPASIVDVIVDSAAGTYGVGFPSIPSPSTVNPGEILFHVVFSRPVVVLGTPVVELATGSLRPNGVVVPNRFATFAHQPQPTQVAFLYTIQADDFSPNLAFANVNVLTGATIYSASSTLSARASLLLPRLQLSSSLTIKVDASSVPATVDLASKHKDGVYGAGEMIDMSLTFSKQVVLLSGLNRNQEWHARSPVAFEFHDKIYIMWTERDAIHAPTQSYLYLRVFTSSTLESVPLASTSAINRVPNTLIDKVAMTAWNEQLYAAWDEDGLLYCAVFQGLVALQPWTLIPNMGANKNVAMAASDPVLLVYNLQLVMVWREKALPMGSRTLVGQIRVAVRNDDLDAPLWIFHDGNAFDQGLNRNPLRDADEPVAVVYRGRMYVAWSELTDKGLYEIVIARRNVQTRDSSTWTYLDALPSTSSSSRFLSCYSPRFAVRRRGIEDMALLLSWHRDTVTSNVSEVVLGQVLDLDWETSMTESIPRLLQAVEQKTTFDTIKLNTMKQEMATCGDKVYSSWLEQEQGTRATERAYVVNLAVLPSKAPVYTGWTRVTDQSNLNHNSKYDAIDSSVVCSTSIDGDYQAGLLWTEYDGYSIKLRFRQSSIVSRTPGIRSTSYGEVLAGTPFLLLATRSSPLGYATCIDKSGATTTVLTFMYIVQPGESSLQLETVGSNALKLNGAVIRDIMGNDPDFALADSRRLSSMLVIDTTPPMVQSVSCTSPSGEYGVGERLLIQITFSSPVVVIQGDDVSSPPTLFLATNELQMTSYGVATYSGGSDSTILTFSYTTGPLDYCEKLEYVNTTSVHRNTWKIKRSATRPTIDAVLTLPLPQSINSLSGRRSIAIKPTPPSVIKVTSSTPDGTYYPGDSILINVLFSLPVVVNGFPVLRLATGGESPTQASLKSGNGTTSLTFEYKVRIGDFSSHLDVLDTRAGDGNTYFVTSLQLASHSTIKRASTYPFTPAITALPAPGFLGSLSSNSQIVIDSTPPAVIELQALVPDGTYGIDEQIDLLLVFSRKVAVIGTPRLLLNVHGDYECTAVYVDGSGTTSLRFAYIPKLHDNSHNVALDILDQNALIMRPLDAGLENLYEPAQILCLSSTPLLAANLTLPIPGSTTRVDAVPSLVGSHRKVFVRTDSFRVMTIESNVPSGVYSPGQQIVLSVIFTGVTIVQGAPRLKLNANSASYATYVGGTGTSRLQFEYIVAVGDSCSVLEAASSNALELNGGQISDTEGTQVPVRLHAAGTAGSLSASYRIEITSIRPSIERVYCITSNGSYGVGDTVHLAVEFSRNVGLSTAHGALLPSLLLQFDAGLGTATYTAGDQSTTLVFAYRIMTGASTSRLEYPNEDALSGDIFARSTTPTLTAMLKLPVPGEKRSLSATCALTVVSTPPLVVAVYAGNRDGVYGLGDKLRLCVHFSYPVYVSALASLTCAFTLSVGDSDFRQALYVGGSTTTRLEFEYIVAEGDYSAQLDYTGADSLQCFILQSTAIPSLQATNTLPLPGAVGSLSSTSHLQIDASSPRVLSVSSDLINGVYGAGQVIDVIITFSEAVRVPLGAAPRLRLAIASNTPVNALLESTGEPYAIYTGGSGTNVLKFTYTSREGDMALPLEYAGVDALSMRPPKAQLTAAAGHEHYRYVSLRLPRSRATGSLSNNRDIHIDTLEPPRVISVGSPMSDGTYTAGDSLLIAVTFSTPVTVTGPAPTMVLDTGNPSTSDTDKQAIYVSGSGTSVLLFEYKVLVGDHVERLEYRRCSQEARSAPIERKWKQLVPCVKTANALQLGASGSSIKRSATIPVTDAVLDLPEVHDLHGDMARNDAVDAATGTAQADTDFTEPLVNEFSISEHGNAINMFSNGIPDHTTTLHKQIKAHRYFIELQRFPTPQSQALDLSHVPNGFSGIFLNGVLFRNHKKKVHATDECGGASDEQGHYFYVDIPTCYLARAHEPRDAQVSLTGKVSRLPSVIVAYALDGFPVYGFYDENGELPTDLDACHGRIRHNGQYAYHLVPRGSFSTSFMPCLKGIDATSLPQSQLNVFRSPVDISAVEGLSVSDLTKFDSFVIDENAATFHTATWLNPENVSVVYTSTTVIVRSTGVPPPGSSYGPFPNVYNRYSVHEQNYVFEFPRHPLASVTPTSLPRDTPIGVMVNGVPFYAASSKIYNGNVLSSTNPAYVLLDKCNGLVDAGGDYRYYGAPDCLLEELHDKVGQPSPVIGFAFDGFPLYGPYDENGQVPSDLDACNGRVGKDGTYRYHVARSPPYLLGCFRGTPSTDATNLGNAREKMCQSLSYAHALKINTDRPQVAHIFTNKRPGVYVTGETIDVVIEWSTAVQVSTIGGLPSLSIQNTSSVATYDPARSSMMQSVFLYLIKSTDVTLEDFSYDVHAAIQLNGGRITRYAKVPVLDAALKLIPIDFDDLDLIRTKTSGLSSKFQLVRSLRVELRGLYHPRAQDLRVRVFHGNRQSTIFDACCSARDAFGLPDTPKVLTNRAQVPSDAQHSTSGVGWDYSFSDLNGVRNLALNGGAIALQSSTSGVCGPMNAIDGKIRGAAGSTQTVAQTLPANDVEESAWWELRLVDIATIGTIRVWIAESDPSVPVNVFTLRVDSNDGIAAVTGDFTLLFSSANRNQELQTKPISHNAVAMIADEKAHLTLSGIGKDESIQAKLLALVDTMPRLQITREPRDAVQSRNGGFTWHITFLDNPRTGNNQPVLAIGHNNVCGGAGIVQLGPPLSIDDDSDPIVYRDEQFTKPGANTSIRDTEQSMFPFWVLLFDGPAVMDIESFADAYDRAIFAYRVDERQANRSVVSIVPPLGTKAQYIRLVAELPRQTLSIAEVEVFTEQLYALSQYAGGTPVRTAYHPGGKTWSPEEPFGHTFGGMSITGAWILAIEDMTVNESNQTQKSTGGISDWVLYITNEAGETMSYFMDFQARVHALPRHGTLYVALDETERDHLDIDGNGVLDSIEADTYLRRYSPNSYQSLAPNTRDRELKEFLLSYEEFGAVPVLCDPSERQLRLPSRVCDTACLAAIKLDPYFYVGLEGDRALKLLHVVGDRVVKYVPEMGFRGLDAFTYSVAVTGQEARVVGTIELTVKDCEDPECRMASFFVHRSVR